MYRISQAYRGRNCTLDIIEGDRMSATPTGTAIYLSNNPVYFVPAHLCVKKITVDEATKERQKLNGG